MSDGLRITSSGGSGFRCSGCTVGRGAAAEAGGAAGDGGPVLGCITGGASGSAVGVAALLRLTSGEARGVAEGERFDTSGESRDASIDGLLVSVDPRTKTSGDKRLVALASVELSGDAGALGVGVFSARSGDNRLVLTVFPLGTGDNRDVSFEVGDKGVGDFLDVVDCFAMTETFGGTGSGDRDAIGDVFEAFEALAPDGSGEIF